MPLRSEWWRLGRLARAPFPPTNTYQFWKFPKISMTRGHTKIKVLIVCIWHSIVSAPSARKVLTFFYIMSEGEYQPRRVTHVYYQSSLWVPSRMIQCHNLKQSFRVMNINHNRYVLITHWIFTPLFGGVRDFYFVTWVFTPPLFWR